MALIESYSESPHGYRKVALTTLRLHRAPDPERFIWLDGGIGPDEDIISLAGLSSRELA